MASNLSLSPGIRSKEVLLEIGNSEKQLWALIHSKGILHSDAQYLYRKIRASYERVLLNSYTYAELQDVEYSLWKLHYKHIDEFRKIVKRNSGDVEINKSGTSQTGVEQRRNNDTFKPFKLFLSEASEFYQNLIVKLRKNSGVSEEALLNKKGWIFTSTEPEIKLKCKYLCHRSLVCMGDLARYKEQCENPDTQNHNWSVAATHYLEATRIWPNSGNPQNQLAVLATYIGDEFLALYHCVRSLAVKEPFPDAWNNLILLFEKNRPSPLKYVSSEVCFEFVKRSGRISEVRKAQLKDDFSNYTEVEGESNNFTDTKLWSLMVRMISFLFITSSFEEFSIALASTIGELDKMLKLEDIELKTMLDSYSQMDLARRGPFRAIQAVCILIFSLKNLMDKPEKEDSEDKNVTQLTQMGLAAAFGVMGRFVERCLEAKSLNHCPLLPSVLVFVEWCSSVLDATEVCCTDQKCGRAISYFFDVFVELLNKLNDNRKETKKLLDSTPLWEDFELRGFVPIASAHFSLDFCSNWEHRENFVSGVELRAERIKQAAMKIASRSNTLQKWITYDEMGRKFCVARSNECHGKKKAELVESSTRREEINQQTNKDTEEQCKRMTEDNPRSAIINAKPSVVEEEEVILFRPLTRYNSAPLSPSTSADEQISQEDRIDQSLPSDDCLRRATSLLMAQNPAQTQTDPWEYHGSSSKFGSDKAFKQQEPSTKESSNALSEGGSEAPIAAGPPSLNAWVLDEGSLSNNRRNGTKGPIEHRLPPIQEIASSSLAGLSINKNENSVISSVSESSNFNASSATYSLPVPSAPLLPDNAAWFTDAQAQPSLPAPRFPETSSPISGYSDWSSTYGPPGYDPRYQVFVNGYPPPGRMTSSEWLRWYRENHKPEKANNYTQPTYMNTPAPQNYDNPYRFDQFDRWGNPLSYNNQYTYIESPGPPPLQPGFLNAGEHKASLYSNCQRPVPFVCSAVTEMRNEPQSLLECLKEKEWRLQRDPNLRGPTFTGNYNS
ncbi:putative telomerase activating protein Est1 [Medicago truncatula]|nr:protein SMG7L isoform X2 [Medicago truncatula]ABD32367.2 cig3, related [Medicago truncatula]KEH36551.1 telomerase activating protein Est1 [Medicago truncatula]RHN71950.1 putative telomerase activating protein Est1 [Medicago truncatula]